jgi:hypothetical protein
VAFIGDEFASAHPPYSNRRAGAMGVPGSFQQSKSVIPKVFLGPALVGAVVFFSTVFYALFVYK